MTNVLIGAGHGFALPRGFDRGAYDSATNTNEHDLNVIVAARAAKTLATLQTGIIGLDTAIFGRASEPNWKGLVKYLHESPTVWGLIIEIHHDSPNAKAAGFGIMPRRTLNSKIPLLCDLIMHEYTTRHMPVKPSYNDVRGLGLLRVMRTPALIWECNITKATSEAVLYDRGDAIAYGIHNWIKQK